MGLQDTLTKQVGPLPVGAWILVVGGGLGIAFYTSKRTPAQVTEYAATGTEPGVGVGSATPGFLPAPVPSAPVAEGYTDNDAWAVAAVRHLIATGSNPTQASIAVRKYLDGLSWTAAEDVLLKSALKAIGPPPIIPVGGGAIPVPIPPTPTKSAPGIWVTAQKASPSTMTLQAMAKRFLGYYAGWGVIFNANRQGVRRPDGTIGMVPISGAIKAGDRIWIPGGKFSPPPK